MLQANALTTLEAVRDASPLAASVSDGRLSLVISAVSDAIESHLRRKLGYFAGTETLPGGGDLKIYLPHWPILSVSAVLIDAEAVTDYVVQAEAGALYRESGWPRKQSRFCDLTGQANPAKTWESISVAYTAGYILPQWSGVVSAKYNPSGIPATLPAILQEAAIQSTLANLSRVSNRPDPALIREKTPGGHEQQWQAGAQAAGGTSGIFLPPGILETVEQFRGKWF